MRHGCKLVLCLVLLVIPMLGCGKHIVYLKGVPGKYLTETPASKPGRGEKIYIAGAVDNRGEAEKMEGNVIFVPEKGGAVTSAVTDAVKDCLSAYGYVVESIDKAGAEASDQGQPARILYTDIESLYCRRETGWVITDIGSSQLSFNLKEKDGTQPLWSKRVTNKAEVVSVWVAYLADTEKAVNNAFADSMKEFEKAISSPDFKNVLTGKAGVSGGPVVSGQ